MRRDELHAYHAKRDFERTGEPRGEVKRSSAPRLSYVIQRHHASRLHFDFRLELDGVLKSWAVPKGPSLDPADKRLAVEVEDHPLDYGSFEGSIPHGQYGGGYVLVWDHGAWVPKGDPREGLARGRLDFELEGERLHGGFHLVRIRGREAGKTNWLLIKAKDSAARSGRESDVTQLATAPRVASFVPELATLARELPLGADWGYEIKLDGYRAIASFRPDTGDVHIVSRNQKDWTSRFGAIARALLELDVASAVVDGEICAVGPDGKTSFQALQNARSSPKGANVFYFIFDLLFVDGFDVRDRPLAVRKAMLESILTGVKAPLAFVAHLEGSRGAKDAKKAFREACRQGLEGIVAKRLERPYTSGRGQDWIKVKCKNEQELVIAGYTRPAGSRTGLGALLLAVHDRGRLRYAGKVGTGFSQVSLTELSRRLARSVRDSPGVEGAPRMRDAVWVEPKLVCEVAFSEWTTAGRLRHPSFVGLREDKAAEDVVVERPAGQRQPKRARAARPSRRSPSHRRAAAKDTTPPVSESLFGIRITHPDRVLDPATGTTKMDVARHLEAVCSLLLPYATMRPLALVRCPAQIGAGCFFQKKKYKGMSAAVHAGRVAANEVLYVDGPQGLGSLVQFGAVELHGWGSRLPEPGKPDWMVLDLDPDVALPFSEVALAALEVRRLLRAIGLKSFCKTTGGKGLHIVAPLVPEQGWDVVRSLAHAIATSLERHDRARYTATMGKQNRVGKIFVDWLRNGEGATAVLPYSARAREGLPVSMPVAWEQLADVDPAAFTVRTVPILLRRRRKDPWATLLQTHQRLPRSIKKLVGQGPL